MLSNQGFSGIIIGGAGRFGCYLADQLSISKEETVIIDLDCESFDKLKPGFPGVTIEGDASNIEVLRMAGISRARAMIAATSNDNTNLMIAQIARDIYDVATVIAVVKDAERLQARPEFDFTIICPSELMSQVVIAEIHSKEG